jgi:hypothetical protein
LIAHGTITSAIEISIPITSAMIIFIFLMRTHYEM